MSSISSGAGEFQRELMRLAEHGNATAKLREKLQEGLSHGFLDPHLLRTALQRAAGRGRVENVRLILEAGAEVEPVSDQELTALYRAADLGHQEIVQMLLDRKAKVGVRDKFGRTAIYSAAMKGHLEILQILLRAGGDVNDRDRDERTVLLHLAAEKPASWSEDGVRDKILRLVLERTADFDAVDRTGRTALQWAAATGKDHLAALLLEGVGGKKAYIEACNNRGKTALHLASENGRAGVVKLLLEYGANARAMSDGGWTALHNASERGHHGVVALLLQYDLDVNAETSSGNTPLHWAAQNGHEQVVKLLLAHPSIKRNVKDADDTTPMLRAAQRKHKPIVQMFSPSDEGNWPTALALEACRGFQGTVVDFGMEQRQNNVTKWSVFDLLYGKDSKDGKPLVTTLTRNVKSKPAFRWIHLPANNVAWVETLMTKQFTESEADDVDGFKELIQILNHQHGGPKVHSRFMRPSCQRMHATHKEPPPRGEANESAAARIAAQALKGTSNISGPSQSKSDPVETKDPKDKVQPEQSLSKAEKQQKKQEKQVKKQEKMGKKPETNGVMSEQQRPTPQKSKPSNDGRKASRVDVRKDMKPANRHGNISVFMPYLHFESDDRRAKMSKVIKEADRRRPRTSESHDLTPDEMLIHAHLHTSPSLHVRRTLDQFYYHGIDTDERDQDQVVYRYLKKRNKPCKIYMVDQLWLWILGKDTIVTSFPQRWEQPKNDPLNLLDGVIEDINSKTRPPVRSVHDLAMLITSRCAGIFDRHRPGVEDYQFLDMFESSIGRLTDHETALFSGFNTASTAAARWLKGQRKRRRLVGQLHSSRELEPDRSEFERDPSFVDALLDIGKETQLLAEIKDIRDELNMIALVLKHQISVLPDMAEHIAEEMSEGNSAQRKMEIKRVKERQKKMVELHLKDVERMSSQAADISSNLTNLLDLKQKHANAFEARFARDQAAGTARQGQTIMVFTLVTIIFLPMSFMAAFFAINIKEFPRASDGSEQLSLGYVSKYMFGIGLAVSVPLIAVAFTLDDIAYFFSKVKKRTQKRWRGDNGESRQSTWPLVPSTQDWETEVILQEKVEIETVKAVDGDTKEDGLGPLPRINSRRTDVSKRTSTERRDRWDVEQGRDW